jgi:hypothetical protein
MAFNFSWSPLTADEEFYAKARDLLTKALNKSPKPPIIVDDILVSELNLGTVPPDLEILEIGDLAEDRFRGIFKMCYSGDAYLTLKTRVQVRICCVLCAFAPSSLASPVSDHVITSTPTSPESSCRCVDAAEYTPSTAFSPRTGSVDILQLFPLL